MSSEKVIFIVGPTAVGKSDTALSLARDIDGEIISCDSMQVYKEINISSNKPSQEILNSVQHYLVNILSVTEDFDVARFNQYALKAINDIHQQGHVPIIVGGSGMYMQVLLDGIFQGGIKNEMLRHDLKVQARQYGNQHLYDKLKGEDPDAAEKIHPNDLRRVIRALEICMTEHMPISQLQKNREGIWGKYDIILVVLDRDRHELYERINTRVEQMFHEGIVDEIRALHGVQWSQTAKKIIGVQEIQGFLDAKYGLEQAKELIKLNTRHLAKRQLTWFRRDKRLQWLTVSPENTPEDIAGIIKRKL